MIIKINSENREYILNECEKQEIEKIYELGGRYFYIDNFLEDVVDVIDFIDFYDSNNNVVVQLCGNTVNVLRELSDNFDENFKSLFDIMQLYPNKRQIKLTEYEKDKLRYMYNKLGCRYFLLNGSTELCINDKKLPISTEEFDRLESVILNLHLKAADEIYDDGGYISLEKIINKFCN